MCLRSEGSGRRCLGHPEVTSARRTVRPVSLSITVETEAFS